MAKKSHALLWIVGLGGAGFLIYDWWKNKNATPALPNTNTISEQGPTTVLPTQPLQTATQGQAAVLQVAPVDLAGNPLPAGISQDMYNKVYTWAITTGKPPVKTFANALIPSEYQGMYNLITVVWPSGLPNAAGTSFWNNLRTKYDPLHQWW